MLNGGLSKWLSWGLVSALALSLGGCSVPNLLGGSSPGPAAAPPTPSVQTGNNLVMPPDLRLQAPTSVAEGYQPNTIGAPPSASATTPAGSSQVAARAPAPQPEQDIYQKYGISKVKADGTEKSKDELQRELKAAMVKQKRQSNPSYGTIFNMGNIFGDG